MAAFLVALGLFGSLLSPVAAVAVVLNLDAAVVFLTPTLLHAARRPNLDRTVDAETGRRAYRAHHD